MMYLSALLVDVGTDPDRPRPGRLWLRNLYRVHQRLCMAFPSAARKPDDPHFLKPFKPQDFGTSKPKQVHVARRTDAGFLFRIDPQAAASAPPEPEATETDLLHGGIVMYCSKWCPDCTRARAWLKARKLDYTEVDVNAVPGAAARVRQWADGNLVTPTFDIDGQIVVDFDESGLKRVLGL